MSNGLLPDFNGKIVVFYIADSDPRYAVTLESPAFEDYGGRLFVVGTHGAWEGWIDGLRSSIAWDQVKYFIVFDSKSEYEKRRAAAGKSGWRGLFR